MSVQGCVCDLSHASARVAETQVRHIDGLSRLVKWLKEKEIRGSAVANAPRDNGKQMIAHLGLTDFFEEFIIGSKMLLSQAPPRLVPGSAETNGRES